MDSYDDTDLYGTAGQPPSAGPYTTVPLLGWMQVVGRRCSSASFIPLLTVLLFAADIVLAIFAGLDMVDRGTARPWLEFAFSIAIASLYTALAAAAVVMYFWERVLRFRYHWVLGLAICAVLAWSNFGAWASWQTRFSSFASSITAADGNAFITWVAVNALGVAGFFCRFVVLALGIGLRYTFDRAVELQNLVVGETQNGKRLVNVLAASAYSSSSSPTQQRVGARPVFSLKTQQSVSNRANSHRHRNDSTSRYERQFPGTIWSTRQQQQQNHRRPNNNNRGFA